MDDSKVLFASFRSRFKPSVVSVAPNPQSGRSNELTVMTANVYSWRGGIAPIVDMLQEHQPDIVCIQEATLSGLKELAELDQYTIVFAPTVPNLGINIHRPFGNAALSKYPLNIVSVDRLPVRGSLEERFWHRRSVMTVSVDCLPGGQTFTVMNTHFSTDQDNASRQAEYLAHMIDTQKPDLVAGDFNLGCSSLQKTTFGSCFAEDQFTELLTFPAHSPRKPIDGLYSPHQLQDYRVHDFGSDHLAMHARLLLN